MIRAVYDCNVIISGIGWNGSARKCLRYVAHRRIFLFVSNDILAEYKSVIPKTLAKEVPEVDPHPKLAWIRSQLRLIEPVPLGKQRSRDAKDDIYLACALAASAHYLVTYDKDLLDLGKLFGIEIIRPAELLKRIEV